MSEFDEEIREFLIESNENLALLDQQLVELEQEPRNRELMSSVFRTIHSIKGTCGFFGFDVLGSVTHLTESILVQLRDGLRDLTPELISLILEAVDAVKLLLQRIEATGKEGDDTTEALRERLDVAYQAASAGQTVQEMLQAIERTTQTAAIEHGSPEPPCGTPPSSDKAIAERDAEACTPVADAQPPSRPVPVLVPQKTGGMTPPGKQPVVEQAGDLQLADSTIRVDVNLLNQLMNLVGELVLTRNQLLQAASGFSPSVQQTSQRLNLITTELQEGVMKTRMQPIGVIWSKLPRVVRDLSSKCGKQIQIEMSGAETELDKSLIEAIRDPLTHIVRNSCDHGIEAPHLRVEKGKSPTGTLSLRAFHEAGAVNIEISDDGAGIDPDRIRAKAIEKQLITPAQAAAMTPAEAINLIFLPGFSTAQQVTSISGRGVGMDVVKTNIEKISGSVEVIAPSTGGTILRIKIPLTLAIIPGLIVSCEVRTPQGVEEERYVIPQSHLVELTRVDLTTSDRPVESVDGAAIYRHRGKLLPLVYLSQLLRNGDASRQDTSINIIILQVEGVQFGLVVDKICDTQEIVVKPLGQQLKRLQCYVGATIMGDGLPALILDVGGISKLAGLESRSTSLQLATLATRSATTSTEMLLFRAGQHARLAIPLSIVNRLEELPAESVEYSAGQYVVRYRDEILTLLNTSSFLGDDTGEAVPRKGKLSVIVIQNGERRVGLLVDGIIDIVQEEVSVMCSSTQAGLLGCAVIGGRVTDLLDVATLERCHHERTWSRSSLTAAPEVRVALCESDHLSGVMMRTFLEFAGYRPVCVNSAAELKAALKDSECEIVLAAEGKLRELPAWIETELQPGGLIPGRPAILLTETAVFPGSADRENSTVVRADRNNRAALLRIMARLLSPRTQGLLDGTHG